MHTSILIDTETLGLKPTAIITELSAVAFRIGEDGLPVVTDHIDLRPDFWEQLAARRTYDADTIAFHRANGTLPETNTPNSIPCIQAIVHLAAFVSENRPRNVWIQGTDFDRPLIEDFCAAHNQPLPWKYSVSRDARTIYAAAFPGEKHAKRPHKALEDCQATLTDLVAALTKLNALGSI